MSILVVIAVIVLIIATVLAVVVAVAAVVWFLLLVGLKYICDYESSLALGIDPSSDMYTYNINTMWGSHALLTLVQMPHENYIKKKKSENIFYKP